MALDAPVVDIRAIVHHLGFALVCCQPDLVLAIPLPCK